MRTWLKVLLVVILVVCVIGLLLILFLPPQTEEAMASLDNTYTAQSEDILNIELELQNRNVEFIATEGDAIQILYEDSGNHQIAFEEKNGVLTAKETYVGNWWQRILSSIFGSEVTDVQVLIPQQKACNIVTETRNGFLRATNLENLQSMELKTRNGRVELTKVYTNEALHVRTSNSDVDIKDVRAGDGVFVTSNGTVNLTEVQATELMSECSNGSVKLNGLDVEETLRAQTSNGDIEIQNSLGKEMFLTSSNGNINGNIATSRSEFSIESRTTNGESNLMEQYNESAPRKLYTVTSNGSIQIEFAQ